MRCACFAVARTNPNPLPLKQLGKGCFEVLDAETVALKEVEEATTNACGQVRTRFDVERAPRCPALGCCARCHALAT